MAGVYVTIFHPHDAGLKVTNISGLSWISQAGFQTFTLNHAAIWQLYVKQFNTE